MWNQSLSELLQICDYGRVFQLRVQKLHTLITGRIA